MGREAPADLIALLAGAGLPAAALEGARRPALVADGEVTWTLAGAGDVLRACDHGVLDLAVVGREELLEDRHRVVELLDLRCCADELVYAAIERGGGRRARVATRLPSVAARHFASTGRQPEVIVVDEPVLALELGLADGVVELAGALRSGDAVSRLGAREVVTRRSARLVAGRAARALLGGRLGDLLQRLRDGRAAETAACSPVGNAVS